jgi:hypothetical protein
MTQIENYYKDKINMLKDILEKEKKEKELQFRAQIQFFSKLDKERKNKFKSEVDKIFNELDQEDKKSNVINCNDNQISKILKAYYN